MLKKINFVVLIKNFLLLVHEHLFIQYFMLIMVKKSLFKSLVTSNYPKWRLGLHSFLYEKQKYWLEAECSYFSMVTSLKMFLFWSYVKSTSSFSACPVSKMILYLEFCFLHLLVNCATCKKNSTALWLLSNCFWLPIEHL